ncbi:MAG TPA: VWA domain-containing protein [Pyrinomonadaceae bacterium]|nr:VWA domain-containing protein [Pyrinomonadaceae bacterium]
MKNKLALIGLIFAAAGVFCANALTETASAQKMSTATPTPSPVAVKPTPTPTPFDDPNEIIKVDTELVNLNVRVVDRNNRPINDLQQKDFKIFEDNKLQEVDFFSRADVPTNYALVIDNSGSLRPQLEKVIEAGKILIDTNKPEDETTIVRFVGRDKISIEQPFTSNKADLVDALDNLYIEGGQTAIIDAVYLAVENVDDYEKSKAQNDRKRRALILVSDGEDRDSYYTKSSCSSSCVNQRYRST